MANAYFYFRHLWQVKLGLTSLRNTAVLMLKLERTLVLPLTSYSLFIPCKAVLIANASSALFLRCSWRCTTFYLPQYLPGLKLVLVLPCSFLALVSWFHNDMKICLIEISYMSVRL